jgi:hypothetical protein
MPILWGFRKMGKGNGSHLRWQRSLLSTDTGVRVVVPAWNAPPRQVGVSERLAPVGRLHAKSLNSGTRCLGDGSYGFAPGFPVGSSLR